ncbi:MAG: hypothetical protein ACRC1H_07335 [Caldilineaceae bacterium]
MIADLLPAALPWKNETLIRVLVAEQDLQLRMALCVWLGHRPGVELAGVARSQSELRSALSTSHAHVLVVDWSLLGQQAAELMALARRQTPELRVMVIWMDEPGSTPPDGAGSERVVAKSALPEALYEFLGRSGGRAHPAAFTES